MQLRHLRYLKTIVEQGTFTRAAQMLHVSQPALSHQVRQLEERLGVQLLDRTGRTVRATDAGTAFLEHASRAISELEAADRAARDVEDLSSGTLRIGVPPSFGGYLIAPLIRRFHERHPGIRFFLTDMTQSEIETALGDDAIDLGLAFSDVHADDVEWRALHAERLALVMSEDHPAAGVPVFDGAALEGMEMVLMSPDFATRQLIDAHLRRHGIRPHVAVETSSMMTIVEIVRKSRLVTILPDVVVLEQSALVARPLDPPFEPRCVALLQRRGGYRSAAARAFVAVAEAFSGELDAPDANSTVR
jgi:LysR family cyn operon transcriptional activator